MLSARLEAKNRREIDKLLRMVIQRGSGVKISSMVARMVMDSCSSIRTTVPKSFRSLRKFAVHETCSRSCAYPFTFSLSHFLTFSPAARQAIRAVLHWLRLSGAEFIRG
jgi:hypothetical protein